ncbi:MAG: hypothetical protein CMJ19_20515 [Phycisphaeraceae bacterium]|nr:hypothetical protein [Phycisphaeraceae bacterium]
MAIYNRPNLYPFIVAQSVSLEAQQQLMGLFWTLALAVILLFLFVGVMMALFRVIRRRMRLNEQSQSRRKTDNLDGYSEPSAPPDPWDESGKRLGQGGELDFDDDEPSDDWDESNGDKK